ncbi:hypothetical protein [Tuwongella immobilis]|uniref:Secreted protein n=1 Tax=Tuwongella immobilis TaxID=692036 RepID=A0A6C2YJJ2_9BACT|nr:hypothetical protein [Tuwongella immobilis]VIP01738.1 Secreted protein OS=Rhodopirellula maiorica SM1 GN=RMSM_03588 PE=4 SV=1 [Tuwongella immobilis]VTR99302.1 Secreted protein OS=Rhodopirellula maiorica SM1 GN=RMSM_03588 PE=4 SV=1 [Tuwongella immobilis]
MRFAVTLLGLLACSLPTFADATTYDGRHDLRKIELSVVYFVPKDRKPLPDWRDRVDYYIKRVVEFHKRELDGISTVVPVIHPKPLVSEFESSHFRRGDQNQTFFSTMEAVRNQLPWKPDRKNGFPVLLVLSDINWRELDDFRRVRLVDGKEVHEGNIARNGRHFPGAESGGSRATYIGRPGYGMGLVSADGWRVPYSGSDCVIYHEGLGHSIGLPHPDPIDDTVMGTAQYRFWINQATLNTEQKKKLGWKPLDKPIDRSKELFTNFSATPTPNVPRVGQDVQLVMAWPNEAKLKSVRLRVQTDLFGEWNAVPVEIGAKLPERIRLGRWEKPTPVSYRIDVELTDGQTAEIWGYFQVKP